MAGNTAEDPGDLNDYEVKLLERKLRLAYAVIIRQDRFLRRAYGDGDLVPTVYVCLNCEQHFTHDNQITPTLCAACELRFSPPNGI